MITADADVRRKVLGYASRFTDDAADPVAVAVNAGPLLAWLEASADLPDFEARLGAMRQQFLNCGYEADSPVTDNPDEFVRLAKVLYAFATAGGAS